jgi:hypothetical protein
MAAYETGKEVMARVLYICIRSVLYIYISYCTGKQRTLSTVFRCALRATVMFRTTSAQVAVVLGRGWRSAMSVSRSYSSYSR